MIKQPIKQPEMEYKLTGKDLIAIGYPESPAISLAIQTIENNFAALTKDQALVLLSEVLAAPAAYLNDEKLSVLAAALQPKIANIIPLADQPVPYAVYGREHIEEGAFMQMESAARLPVAVAGALMPDAHHGYGLPIGGVLATRNAIIPYGVGVDIGCRMCLSIFDIDAIELDTNTAFFSRELGAATLFGSGGTFKQPHDHEVMDHAAFNELDLLKGLKDRAWRQLGSSGSGNHFVEFGVVEIAEADDVLKVPAGTYLGLLSHSGSRALGANIAGHYTQLAKQLRLLPPEAANLAWLDMNEEAGMEYWIAMNLAGDYASACHHIIHEKIAQQLGRAPLKMVENHHNFAWKEYHDGLEVIVHRKGATPAGKDVLGIIPGSMTAPGFIVKGKGITASVSSASHGAGRKMSRTAALKQVTKAALENELSKQGVTLLGGGLDEAPFAYKDIETVMQSQQDLVTVLGKFTPKIVKMCSDVPNRRGRGRKKNNNEAHSGE